jgi:hypothetical protein
VGAGSVDVPDQADSTALQTAPVVDGEGRAVREQTADQHLIRRGHGQHLAGIERQDLCAATRQACRHRIDVPQHIA